MKNLIYIVISLVIFIITNCYALIIFNNNINFLNIPYVNSIVLIAFAIQWLAFIPAILMKTEKFYDLVGSLTYISIIVLSLFLTDSIETFAIGNIIVAGLIMIWALRLGTFLFKRIHRAGEDKRFHHIKHSFPRFFMAWTLQGMWVFICSSAALVAITSQTGVVINIVFLIGVMIFLFGFIVEVIADQQKSNFRADKNNHNRFINQGLWARSRHPNYFGEITLWLGISIISISSFTGLNYLALFSPLFTYLLLNYVSGVRLLEEQAEKKWGHLDEYQYYKNNTPKLIPRLKTIH